MRQKASLVAFNFCFPKHKTHFIILCLIIIHNYSSIAAHTAQWVDNCELNSNHFYKSSSRNTWVLAHYFHYQTDFDMLLLPIKA